jgi:hypothetical protein
MATTALLAGGEISVSDDVDAMTSGVAAAVATVLVPLRLSVATFAFFLGRQRDIFRSNIVPRVADGNCNKTKID